MSAKLSLRPEGGPQILEPDHAGAVPPESRQTAIPTELRGHYDLARTIVRAPVNSQTSPCLEPISPMSYALLTSIALLANAQAQADARAIAPVAASLLEPATVRLDFDNRTLAEIAERLKLLRGRHRS